MNMQPFTPSPAQVALELAERGFPVFPCNSKEEPLTPHGFKDASCDPERIAAFRAQFPSALVGVPTGKASGLFVVDLDVDRDTGEAQGETTLAGMGLSHLLARPGAATPRGGRHLYFKDAGRCALVHGKVARRKPQV
ncbi:MAG: bifunctional DNA primase/polymerase [Rhodobacterales bacterium]|nr:bifunctional DNA primase/polymerase [Rhodobacterales bacterium]